MSNPQIVCLCGSTRFRDLFIDVARDLTLKGEVVLAPFVYSHADGTVLAPGQKASLDDLHRHKIAMSDYVLIVSDESGYYGESTRNEIRYAESLGIPIEFLRRAENPPISL